MDIDAMNRKINELMKWKEQMESGSAPGAGPRSVGELHDAIEAVDLEKAPHALRNALQGIDVMMSQIAGVRSHLEDLLERVEDHLDEAKDKAEAATKAEADARAQELAKAEEKKRLDDEKAAKDEADRVAAEEAAKNAAKVEHDRAVVQTIVEGAPDASTPEDLEAYVRAKAPEAGLDADVAAALLREEREGTDD